MKNRIRELRTEKKMSQKDLGDLLNVTYRSIGFYETGERDPDTETLSKLADIFNCSIDYILCRTDHRNVVVKEVAPGIIIAQRADSTKEYSAEELRMARDFIEFMRKKKED